MVIVLIILNIYLPGGCVTYFITKETPVQLQFLENFKNTFFAEHLWMATFESLIDYLDDNAKIIEFSFQVSSSRSSHQGCFMKKGVLKISQNSQQYACVRVFCNLIEKETLAQVFSSELCKILRTPFLQNTSGWLLLPICYANKIERAEVV